MPDRLNRARAWILTASLAAGLIVSTVAAGDALPALYGMLGIQPEAAARDSLRAVRRDHADDVRDLRRMMACGFWGLPAGCEERLQREVLGLTPDREETP